MVLCRHYGLQIMITARRWFRRRQSMPLPCIHYHRHTELSLPSTHCIGFWSGQPFKMYITVTNADIQWISQREASICFAQDTCYPHCVQPSDIGPWMVRLKCIAFIKRYQYWCFWAFVAWLSQRSKKLTSWCILYTRPHPGLYSYSITGVLRIYARM